MSDISINSQQIQIIMDVVHDGMIVIQDEDIIMSNPIFAEMLDFEIDDLLDLPFDDVLDSLSRRHDAEKIERFLSGEALSCFTTRLSSKNGSTIHVEIKPTILTVDGRPSILASVRNISTQIALESAVTELENRFATLYDMSPVAYFTLNRDGIVEQVNAAAEELLGCEAEDILGKALAEFLPEPKVGYDIGADIIREVMRGKSVTGLEMEMKSKNNRTIWVSASSRALASGVDRPTEIGFTAIDISRRRATEQRLREESERANLYLDVMTSDLNMTNQNVLFVLEDLSISLDLPDRLKILISETSWSLRNSARMIANMGVLISLDHEPPMKTRTKLLPHFNKAIREARRDFEWKQIDIKSNIPDDGFEVNGHAFIWYIFFNIIHFSGTIERAQDVTLEINADLTEIDDMVRIEFIDHNLDIPDEQKTLIFRRGGETEDLPSGTGIGLAVVDRYISDLGGRIWIEDMVPGNSSKGSKFIILLPIWREAIKIPTIMYYKSEHCVFCGPVLDSLTAVLNELGIGTTYMQVINVDDPNCEVNEKDLPALPTLQMGNEQLSGFLSEDDLRSAISKLIFMSGG
ncbi:PAS domain-containing sensor histidine kinase [Candidatus Thorarchaeota archaeon]|nr:MAG: PAS domain-containing sensor histidine kinase [Candidatus Thorarchaeota archaeon]